MRTAPGYQFAPLRGVPVPKSNGKYRIICIPTVRDRVVQRAASEFLATDDRCGLANAVSYGFIPTRSVEKAVQQARALRREKPWVYKTDITAFFDSVDRSILAHRINRHVRDRSLHSLLVAASQCEIFAPNKSLARRIDEAGIKKGRGIRQGMPLSPFFGNLLLKDFDAVIQNAGISMVRYADDLICLSASEADCLEIHGLVAKALKREGLDIPPIVPDSKSKVYAPDDPADFLGLQLRPQNGDYLLEIPSNQTAKIRQRILTLADLSAPENKGITLTSFIRRLDGQLAGYSGAYEFAHNAEHFESILDAARREVFAQLLKKTLGIDVNFLSAESRRFLGLTEL
jgi:hypothetical protein